MKSLRNKIARVLFAPLVCAAFTFVFAACSNYADDNTAFLAALLAGKEQTQSDGGGQDSNPTSTSAPTTTTPTTSDPTTTTTTPTTTTPTETAPTPAATYTITFNANDRSETPATAAQTFTAKTPHALKTIAELGFSKTGFYFAGWGEAADAEQAKYSDGTQYVAAQDATLYALWSEIPVYSVKIPVHVDGSVTATPATGTAGTEITLLAVPNAGYEFGTYTVVDVANNPIPVMDGKFTMPQSDVFVTGVFAAINYNVVVGAAANGNVTASAQTATVGTEVTLTASPDNGYMLAGLVVKDSNGVFVPTSEAEGSIKFTMPAKDVTVAATFVAISDSDMLNVPLTLEAIEAGAKVTFKNNAAGSVVYCINGGARQTIESGVSKEIVLENAGDKVAFYGDNATYATGDSSFSNIACDENCYVYGNIMSLIKSEGFASVDKLSASYTFYKFFSDNSRIKNKADAGLLLPATTLAEHCYSGLFSGCTGLISAPALPATTLAAWCYDSMFSGCEWLRSAPELPAMTLVFCCYNRMFYRCKYLRSAPDLPAMTLVFGCYSEMFALCEKLNNVNCLATDINAPYCTFSWLLRVASNGTFTKAPGVPWHVDDSGIPEGWTVNDSDQQVMYTIKMPDNAYYGTVTSSATCAASGTEITLTIKPENGYEFESLSVTDVYGKSVAISGTGNTRTFTMPASLVTVRYYFSAIKYNVNIGSSENGEVTADTTKWASGNRVKLSIRPDDGYELKELVVTASDGLSVSISGTGDSRTFTMPAKDVTVTATFAVRKYNVNIGSSENGIVTADKTKLVSGERVRLTIRPENGYELETLIVKDSSGASVYLIGIGDSRTFTMPAKDVTVTATFSAIKYHAVNIGSFEHGTVTADKTGAASGTTVTLDISPASGYELAGLALKCSGASVALNGTGNNKSFIMPDKDVEIVAAFSQIVSSLGSQPKYAKDAVDKSVWDLSKLDTARNVSYMYEIEKDVILEMNMARTNPKKYAELYIAPRLNNFDGKIYTDKNGNRHSTVEGTAAVEDCIDYMKSQSSRSVLQPSVGLTKAAKFHSSTQSQTSQTGHDGTDGSNILNRIKRYGLVSISYAENIHYGMSGDYVDYAASAREIVVDLLIDNGVSNRGHRVNIMNEESTTAGVGFEDHHVKCHHDCVIDFAACYEEKQ